MRDAAAYLLWSLSRACSAEDMTPFSSIVATRLISVGCFDREVGVRRAASAAFQEGVGRLVRRIPAALSHCRLHSLLIRAFILKASTSSDIPTSIPSVFVGSPLA